MRSLPYTLVDVFTDVALRGNPVAVFTAADGLTANEMQDIAREMNLSETVFVSNGGEAADISVRIFTPVNELPFAGHPLLGTATAVVAGRDMTLLSMVTRVGVIPFTIANADDPCVARIEMRQPMPVISAYPHADLLLRAFDLDASTLPVEMYVTGPRHVFIGIDTVARLSAIRPDLRAIAHLPDVAFNCFAGDGERWRLRMFSPAYGVAEDSGTGSAASPLLLHLIRHGLRRLGDSILIEQGVEMGRHSLMQARVTGASFDDLALYVAGSCVVVGDGRLTRWQRP